MPKTERVYYDAAEIAEMLGISKGKARGFKRTERKPKSQRAGV